MVANALLQGTGKETRNHHREGHEGRAKRIVGRLVLALAVINKVEHIGREAEAVAELFEEDTDVDDEQTGGQGVGEIDVDQIGQGDGDNHGPQPALQAITGGTDATEDATQREADDTYRALDETKLTVGEAKTTILYAVDEEKGRHFGQQAFGHAIEEHEADADDDLGLLEEGDKRVPELVENVASGLLYALAVLIGTGQGPTVVEPQANEETCNEVEDEAPREGDAAGEYLQGAGKAYEQSGGEDRGDAVERGAYAYEIGLLMLVETKHIKTIGSNVVGGTGEGHQPEEGQRAL